MPPISVKKQTNSWPEEWAEEKEEDKKTKEKDIR